MSTPKPTSASEITTLPLARLRTDGGTQPRAELDEEVLQEYAAAYKRGDQFPPVRAVFDRRFFWLYDGFHRLAAQRRNKVRQVRADVQSGTQNDAVWLGAAANQMHGLRRTNEDKQNAIRMALGSAAKMSPAPSSRQIAIHVGVSHSSVEKYRGRSTGQVGQLEKRAGADGRVRNVVTSPDAETPSTGVSPNAGASLNAAIVDQVGHVLTDSGIGEVFLELRPTALEVADALDAVRRKWGRFHRDQVEANRIRILQSRPYSDVRGLIERELKHLAFSVRAAAPHAECPYCKGAPAPDDIGQRCEACGGGGWLGRLGYENAPPEMTAKARTKVPRATHEAGHA